VTGPPSQSGWWQDAAGTWHPPYQATPPGWYRDPSDQAPWRWWDGFQWTNVTNNAAVPPPNQEGPYAGAAAVEPVRPTGKPWPVFVSDLRESAKALKRAPALWIITVVIQLAAVLPRLYPALAILTLLVDLFLLGFVGVQRVWFARLFRNRPFSNSEIFPLAGRFFGRFLVLELLASIPSLVVFLPFLFVAIGRATNNVQYQMHPGTHVNISPYYVVVPVLCMTVLFDVLGTFIVPTLSLRTRSAVESIRLGIRMIRQTWPHSAWYIFAPALTLTAITFTLPRSSVPTGIDFVLVGASALIALWFKGAITAFYLRAFPGIPDGGAV
jgi:uncharacterized membrane protein